MTTGGSMVFVWSPRFVINALWLVWIVSWFGAALWAAPAVKRPTVGREVLYRTLAIAGWILVFGFARGAGLGRVVWRPAGLGLWMLAGVVFAGLAFTWWARLHLGRLWSSGVTRKADHHVVDTGPYGLVRHPIYTGVIAAMIATAAARGTTGAALGVALLIAGFVVKARLEESFLRQELGAEAYDAYARRVPMLVPFLRG